MTWETHHRFREARPWLELVAILVAAALAFAFFVAVVPVGG